MEGLADGLLKDTTHWGADTAFLTALEAEVGEQMPAGLICSEASPGCLETASPCPHFVSPL